MVKKVRIGKEMMVRDLSPLALSAMEKGERLKLSSPEEGLVAILKSEIKGVDIQRADPEIVAFRPLRIFHPSPHSSPQRMRGEGEGKGGESEGKDRINLKEEFHGTGSGEEKRDHRSV